MIGLDSKSETIKLVSGMLNLLTAFYRTNSSFFFLTNLEHSPSSANVLGPQKKEHSQCFAKNNEVVHMQGTLRRWKYDTQYLELARNPELLIAAVMASLLKLRFAAPGGVHSLMHCFSLSLPP